MSRTVSATRRHSSRDPLRIDEHPQRARQDAHLERGRPHDLPVELHPQRWTPRSDHLDAEVPPAREPHPARPVLGAAQQLQERDRKSTRLNSSHTVISYAVFCLKKKKKENKLTHKY